MALPESSPVPGAPACRWAAPQLPGQSRSCAGRSRGRHTAGCSCHPGVAAAGSVAQRSASCVVTRVARAASRNSTKLNSSPSARRSLKPTARRIDRAAIQARCACVQYEPSLQIRPCRISIAVSRFCPRRYCRTTSQRCAREGSRTRAGMSTEISGTARRAPEELPSPHRAPGPRGSCYRCGHC
jgi:hypothetical protein